MPLFYKPSDGVAANCIPFFWDGQYHLFYMKDVGEGTSWFHSVTRDFVAFEDWGEALPRGGVGDPDLQVRAGCVLHADGVFHSFYTGSNPQLRQAGGPEQVVLHATSPDLRTWSKDGEFRLAAPADLGYEPHDWRDPVVFWNKSSSEHWMLLAARRGTGPSRGRGCTALCVSRDLKQWDVREPFWSPDAYAAHESPDLFRMGAWWHLVYSTSSDRSVTHHRRSKTLAGPWVASADDAFDGRAYATARTAGDGHRRYAFGWLCTREGDSDDGSWQRGGSLVVHELRQQKDGSLAVRPPRPVLAPYGEPVALTPRVVTGNWRIHDGMCSTAARGRSAMLHLGPLPETCVFEVGVTVRGEAAVAGVLLRADDALERYYQVRLEAARQRIVIDRWPRAGEEPFMVERLLRIRAGRTVQLRALIDGTCLVVYANDRVALSCRMYAHRLGGVGLFAADGDARFERMQILGHTGGPR
jgi:beta-fructofuranosidase